LLHMTISAVFGFLLALLTTRSILSIDYDSGAQMRVVKVGPFAVREEALRRSKMGAIVLEDGGTGLTGRLDWHVAHVFWGNSNRSADFEGGNIMHYANEIEDLLRGAEQEEVSRVKEEFLRAVSQRQGDKLRQIVEELELHAERKGESGSAIERR